MACRLERYLIESSDSPPFDDALLDIDQIFCRYNSGRDVINEHCRPHYTARTYFLFPELVFFVLHLLLAPLTGPFARLRSLRENGPLVVLFFQRQ